MSDTTIYGNIVHWTFFLSSQKCQNVKRLTPSS